MNTLEFLRQLRILDYAVFDLVASILGMWLLSPMLSKLFLKIKVNIPKKSWIIWALPIGIIVHLMVNAMTPMTVRFIDPSGHYILKIIIIFLTVIGFWKVKRVQK